jgi:hypothetical protein
MYTCLHPHVSLRKYTVLSHKCMNTVCLYAQYGKIIGNIIDYICMFYLHKYDQICIYRMNIYIIKLYIGIMMYLTCTDIYIHTITYIYIYIYTMHNPLVTGIEHLRNRSLKPGHNPSFLQLIRALQP